MPVPVNNYEKFLMKIAGEDVGDLPEPVNNYEYWLKKIAEGGSGGGGGGGTGGVLLVTINYDESSNEDRMDKTWQEIHDALATDGKQVIFTFPINPSLPDLSQFMTLASINHGGTNSYQVNVNNGGTAETYNTTTANGYPAMGYN